MPRDRELLNEHAWGIPQSALEREALGEDRWGTNGISWLLLDSAGVLYGNGTASDSPRGWFDPHSAARCGGPVPYPIRPRSVEPDHADCRVSDTESGAYAISDAADAAQDDAIKSIPDGDGQPCCCGARSFADAFALHLKYGGAERLATLDALVQRAAMARASLAITNLDGPLSYVVDVDGRSTLTSFWPECALLHRREDRVRARLVNAIAFDDAIRIRDSGRIRTSALSVAAGCGLCGRSAPSDLASWIKFHPLAGSRAILSRSGASRRP